MGPTSKASKGFEKKAPRPEAEYSKRLGFQGAAFFAGGVEFASQTFLGAEEATH